MTEFRSEQLLIGNPIEVGREVEFKAIKFCAWITGLHGTESLNPLQHRGVGRIAIGGVKDRRQNSEEFEVPLMFTGRDCGMVILQKSPDLAERDEVVDLNI